MPFQCLSRARPAKSLLAILLVSSSLSLAAEAQGRSGVAIEYRGASPVQSSAPAAPVRRMASTEPADRATARISFRYPDSAAAPAPAAPAPAPRAAPVPSPTPAPVEVSSLPPLPVPAGQGMAPVRAPAVQQAPAPMPAASAPPAATGDYVETGIAILYGDEFAGLPTANGEIFAQSEMTAAHPALPLPSLVHVTNLETGREVVVRVNDRGPFEDGANLQLSRQAATALGMGGAGRAQVSLRYLGPAPMAGPQAVSRVQPEPQRPAPVQPQPAVPVRLAAAPQPAPQDELLGGSVGQVQPAPAPRLMSLQPAPVSAPAPRMAEAGSHFVQLASFNELGNAEAMYRSVEGRMQAEIVPARVNGADFFRVRVGPFPDRESAEQVRARLYADGTADGRVVSGH
ncbi:septal ring lytic transglycosylase RlpA family protein [Hyphomonas sp.]|uniref:septal ring lytic transglycosylase RlpA family protein n=1 Tax=Hyphomonas sp. TaxID=87 RepID=UPI00391BF35D